MAGGDLTRHFGPQLVDRLGQMLAEGAGRAGTRAGFDRDRFQSVSAELHELSLMRRVRRIGEALVAALPEEPERAWAVMAAALPVPLPESGKPFNDGHWMLPLAAYWAARYEAADRRDELWPVAIRALAELTQRGTAEFAVRPFAADRPKRMLETVLSWREHPSFHVRRLASEGTRPYLPWGGKLRVTTEVRLELLEAVTSLATDNYSYVRRSVGNHVRDWRRIDPEVADRWIAVHAPPPDVKRLALPKQTRQPEP